MHEAKAEDELALALHNHPTHRSLKNHVTFALDALLKLRELAEKNGGFVPTIHRSSPGRGGLTGAAAP